MKRILLFFTTLIFAASCSIEGSSDDDDDDLGVEQITIVYFMGTNLKSSFYTNITDMKYAINNGALGKAGRLIYILPSSSTSATMYELSLVDGSCEAREIKSYSSFSTLSSSSITEVLNDVKSEVELSGDDIDRTYNMIISGHGTGWVLSDHPYLRSISSTLSIWEKSEEAHMTRFIGYSSDGYINIDDLRIGIEDSGLNFGYMLFDMCLMSNIETLYRLKDCTDYIVASPAEVLSSGFPYTNIMPYLFTNNGVDFDLQGVCEAYYSFYTTYYVNCGCVAVCVTDELEPLANIVNSMILDDCDADQLQTYEKLSSGSVFYDLGHYINVAGVEDINLAAFNEQLDRAFPVDCRLHTPTYYTAMVGSYGEYAIDYYSGVTTSAPSTKYRDEWVLEPWVIASGQSY